MSYKIENWQVVEIITTKTEEARYISSAELKMNIEAWKKMIKKAEEKLPEVEKLEAEIAKEAEKAEVKK